MMQASSAPPLPAAGGLGQVFAAHRAQLKRAAQQILGDTHSAEDLVHDAYLKAVESGDDAQGAVRQPLAYAVQMVRHMAIDRCRRATLEQRLFEVRDDGGAEVPMPATATPEALAIDRQQLSIVEEALAQLPERARRVFELYRLEGRTQRDIAAMFGISPTLVNFMIRDALDQCRDALRQGRPR
jgi:RNA polymerase sigma factor (sigma-70 family)